MGTNNLPIPPLRIVLIHWNESEAQARADRLRALGFAARHLAMAGPELLKDLAVDRPDAILIDLNRLPSHGREVGLALRHQKATRQIPLVFVEGEAEKVGRIRQLLPDAIYTTWDEIVQAVRLALETSPVGLVVPKSTFDAYSSTPLVKKLGIKAGMRVLLLAAPPDTASILGDLPAGVTLLEDSESQAELGLWFVSRQAELQAGIGSATGREDLRALWIFWPKKTSRLASDVSERSVRAAGLEMTWVDYKICSVDETWSRLLFTRRKV